MAPDRGDGPECRGGSCVQRGPGGFALLNGQSIEKNRLESKGIYRVYPSNGLYKIKMKIPCLVKVKGAG